MVVMEAEAREVRAVGDRQADGHARKRVTWQHRF
jgi:hypothetical protein